MLPFKYVPWIALTIVAVVALTTNGSKAEGVAGNDPIVSRVDVLEANHITVKDTLLIKGTKYKISMNAGPVAGIWISRIDNSQPCVAIYLQDDKPVVGVYGKFKVGQGHPAAISIDERGAGILQLLDKDGKSISSK